MVVKRYSDDRGRATFTVMRALQAGAAEAGSRPVTGAEALAWLAADRLLVQTPAAGCPLHDRLGAPGAAVDAVRAAGAELARLHDSVVPGLPGLDVAREIRKITEQTQAVAAALPAAPARRVVAVGATLADALAGDLAGIAGREPLVPTHGDYQPKNILLAAGPAGVVANLVDFDRCAAAPAARDVGHFMAQSATMIASRSGSLADAAPWNTAFLDGYAAGDTTRRGPGDPATVALFTARSLLEILFYRLVVRPMPDRSFAGAWIDECERRLAARR